MASNESDPSMTNPVEDLTGTDAYNSERAQIALERAELAKLRATMSNGNGKVVNALTSVAKPPAFDDDAFNAPSHIVEAQDEPADTDEDDKPAEWAHDTKVMDDGEVLEYRKPDSSALIAIAMAGSEGFTSGQQMSIFNKFMSKHLSNASLSYVLGRMTDPDDEFDLGELISQLTGE